MGRFFGILMSYLAGGLCVDSVDSALTSHTIEEHLTK